MANFRFNLDVTYKNKNASTQASKFIKEGKKIPKTFYNQNETAIYIATSFNSRYIKKNTGLKIKPEEFDVKTQTIKLRDSKSVQLQLLLNRIKDDCLTEYRELILKKEDITFEKIENIILKSINQDPNKTEEETFFETYEQFYLWKQKTVNISTMPRYNVLRKQLIKYQDTLKTPLSIHCIDKRFSEEFALFLIEDLKVTNNTIFKYLKSLKCFLNYCLENELTENKKFKSIKTSEDATSIFVLEEFEIEDIQNLTIDNKSLSEVRDVFCFLCYTGQRYSDIKRLKWKDIIKKEDHTYWKLFQFKTKSTSAIEIPLLTQAIALLEKRNVNVNHEDFVFKVLSNQKMNQHLKVIGKEAGLKGQFTTRRIQGNKDIEIVVDRSQKLSTHTGRKSFITLAIKKGMPVPILQKISGHASMKTLKPYINISNNDVSEAMFKFFKP